ncbi:hypothetical protein Krac_1588 [Ktedonobacter racemifer DSM 44963]|uniref:Uncharacterized protein n=1 Tax=Ktedonobacter racemifer DSM 44963 TaxID=485913 RepID=D6U2I2_KTERA|nr:hypothetical protein Krac_1588 [Ktedonobacter racemifer DSM 44963]
MLGWEASAFFLVSAQGTVVLQKIKAQQIEHIYERSPRGKDAKHSHFFCNSDSYAVITCSAFSAQNFLQHYRNKPPDLPFLPRIATRLACVYELDGFR